MFETRDIPMLNMQLIYNLIGIPALHNETSSYPKMLALSSEGVQLGMRVCSYHDINNYYAFHMNVDVKREEFIQNPSYKLVLMLY